MKNISLILGVAAIMATASCKETGTTGTPGTGDSAVLMKDNEVPATVKEETNWDKVDFTSPIVKYSEITSKDIEVRGTDMYSIYGVDEAMLFATGKADINATAQASLGEVCASIKSHYPENHIRVYGYTDAVGAASDNKELSMKRAEAVKSYLVGNCGMNAANITTVAEGEAKPAATNDNAQGRQQNRRVLIVAMK